MSENQTKACNSNVTCHMACPYVDPWDMVNNFCFHVYAQKSLFILGQNSIRVHRADSLLKISLACIKSNMNINA